MEESKILELARALDQKQTWIRKGFRELFEKLNKTLEEYTPATTNTKIGYVVKEWQETTGEPLRITLNLEIDKNSGVRIVLQQSRPGYIEYWKLEELETPSITMVREIVQSMPKILAFFVEELEKKNAEEQAIVDTLKNMLEQLEQLEA